MCVLAFYHSSTLARVVIDHLVRLFGKQRYQKVQRTDLQPLNNLIKQGQIILKLSFQKTTTSEVTFTTPPSMVCVSEHILVTFLHSAASEIHNINMKLTEFGIYDLPNKREEFGQYDPKNDFGYGSPILFIRQKGGDMFSRILCYACYPFLLV